MEIGANLFLLTRQPRRTLFGEFYDRQFLGLPFSRNSLMDYQESDKSNLEQISRAQVFINHRLKLE